MRLLLFLALVLLTGCASSSGPAGSATAPRAASVSPSPALNAVNDRIGDTPVTLTLTDGKRHREARFVVVGDERTTFVLLRKGPQSVETARVDRVERRVGGGRSVGAKIGAAPGMILMGLSLLVGVSGDGFEEVVGYAYAGVGFGAAAIGALFGSVVGHAVSPGEIEVLYQGPIDRYLNAPEGDL
jgi:hypothetical protein